MHGPSYVATMDCPQLELEADARNLEVVVAELALKTGNTVSTPAVKITVDQAEEELPLELLDLGSATLFQSVLMMMSYWARGRADLTEAV